MVGVGVGLFFASFVVSSLAGRGDVPFGFSALWAEASPTEKAKKKNPAQFTIRLAKIGKVVSSANKLDHHNRDPKDLFKSAAIFAGTRSDPRYDFYVLLWRKECGRPWHVSPRGRKRRQKDSSIHFGAAQAASVNE